VHHSPLTIHDSPFTTHHLPLTIDRSPIDHSPLPFTAHHSPFTHRPIHPSMAYKNKIITNPKTGQIIKFIQTAQDTGGRMLEMESTFKPNSVEPPLHYHPHQEENFRVISGELSVNINGMLKKYTAGDKFSVPKNTPHSMWNSSDAPTVLNWRVSPALSTEYFFENSIGLANDGRTNEKGMPPFLQVALLANKYSDIVRFAQPPFIIQKLIFSLLAPIAWLRGYRGTYKKYLD
jgi:quercetin dioxygenase-like cupin family protein